MRPLLRERTRRERPASALVTEGAYDVTHFDRRRHLDAGRSRPRVADELLRNSLHNIVNWPVYADVGGPKNRIVAACKMSNRQVLISRTRSVCGEVAERLKAAVC
jgi:hypothetical protein